MIEITDDLVTGWEPCLVKQAGHDESFHRGGGAGVGDLVQFANGPGHRPQPSSAERIVDESSRLKPPPSPLLPGNRREICDSDRALSVGYALQ